MRTLFLPSIALAAAISGAAFASDPFEGTWKLDVARSEFNTSQAPRSLTATIEASKIDMKLVAYIVYFDGKALHRGFDAKYNEMDYPYTLNPAEDTISLKRVHANTIVTVSKKKGKTVATIRWVVSKDGRTITGVEKGKNVKGEPVTSTYIYGKQ